MKSIIGRKMLNGIIRAAIAICLAACIGVSIEYWLNVRDFYTNKAYSYTESLASYIDGNRVPAYLETKETDEYYDLVQTYMDSLCDGENVRFLYVIYPNLQEIVYIWDAHNAEDYSSLGDTEIYMEGEYERLSSMSSDNYQKNIKIATSSEYGLLAIANTPIIDSNGKTVAIACADISMPDILKNLGWFIISVMFATLVITCISMLIFYKFVGRAIVNPLSVLNEGAGEMVKRLESPDGAKLKIETGDEFEEVAESFNRMEDGLKMYISELEYATEERSRIGTELGIATAIQANYIPNIFPAFPDRNEFDIYASMTPAKEVGGDFYDFFFIDHDHLCLVMADVSGKGIGAAMFMMISKTFIDAQARNSMVPSEILAQVNKRLCENNSTDMFVTVWLGILEISTGKLTAANAGHEYPILRKNNGNYEVLKDKHGFVLGGMEFSKYTDYEVSLAPGDSIFVYTDGATEAINENEELYGMDRLVESLNRTIGKDMKETLETVHADIDAYAGHTQQFDDITMLGVSYFGA